MCTLSKPLTFKCIFVTLYIISKKGGNKMFAILTMVLLGVGTLALLILGVILCKKGCINQIDYAVGGIVCIIFSAVLGLLFFGVTIGMPLDQAYKAQYWPYRFLALNETIEETEALLTEYKSVIVTGQGVAAAGEGLQIKRELRYLYEELNKLVRFIDFCNSGKNRWWLGYKIRTATISQ